MSSFTPTGQQWGPRIAADARAGFWPRAFADLIDGVVLTIAYLILSGALHASGFFFSLLISAVYFTYLEGGPRGQTLGKSAMHIRVISLTDSQPLGYQRALIRDLARLLSAIPFYLGYLWMLWSPERQTWHDTIGGAVVVPVSSYPAAPM